MDKALTILAGCPDGATEAALAMFGVTRDDLDALVAEGLIRCEVQRVRQWKIPRYWLLDK